MFPQSACFLETERSSHRTAKRFYQKAGEINAILNVQERESIPFRELAANSDEKKEHPVFNGFLLLQETASKWCIPRFATQHFEHG